MFVLFSTNKRAKFLHHIDKLQALGKVSLFQEMIGMYEGRLEFSYLMLESEWEKEVAWLGFCADQEEIWDISPETSMSVYNHVTNEPLGRLVEVGKDKAFLSDGFTYSPERNKWWVLDRMAPTSQSYEAEMPIYDFAKSPYLRVEMMGFQPLN